MNATGNTTTEDTETSSTTGRDGPDVRDKPRKSKSGFFAIDRRAWARVCDSGDINAASAYLVLAQGTGRSNRNTSWSATSLTTYTGMRWSRACRAIDKLVKELKVIAHGPDHTTKRPRYVLCSWKEISGMEHESEHLYPSRRKKTQESDIVSDSREELIWLPNTIVTGTDRGEESPVRKLRMTGDIWALRLFIDLYHAQNLRDDGGISPAVLRECYDAQQVGERATWIAWAFRPRQITLWWEPGKSAPFAAHRSRPEVGTEAAVFGSLLVLQQHGLLTFVPHIWENETNESEIIHPYGIVGCGEDIEIEIATAARQAAYVIGSARLIEQAQGDGFRYLCPVRRTIPAPAMIGVARLRYRPHTRYTRNWYGELQATASKWIAEYNAVWAENRPQVISQAR